MDEAGLAPRLPGGSLTQAERSGRKRWYSNFLGVFPTSSSLCSLEASQILRDLRKGGHPLCVNLGTASSTVLYSPFLIQPHSPPDPSAGPCQLRTAYFPIPSWFFFHAVSGCTEHQGPTQIPRAPRSPITHRELPTGPPQALLHIGTLPAPRCPLGAGRYSWDCVILETLLKNLGGNYPVLRTALVMPRSP